jgi:hypothetical protein
MWALARHHYALREREIHHRFYDPEQNENYQVRSLVGEMCSREILGESWDAMREHYLGADRGDLVLPDGRIADVKTPKDGLRHATVLYNEKQFVDNCERYELDSIVLWGTIRGDEPAGIWQLLGACLLNEVAKYEVTYQQDDPDRAARRIPKAVLRDWADLWQAAKEPESSEAVQAGKPLESQDSAEGGGDPADPASLDLRDLMRGAMLAQGKVDPDEVYAIAEQIDLDEASPGDERPPLDERQTDIFDEGASLDHSGPDWA